jgi:hypothetical protein
MALFQKKSKMENLEAVLAGLRKRAVLLADKRNTAQAALDAAMAGRQVHMIDGDLSDEKLAAKLQGAVDTGKSALLGILDAISVLQNQIGSAEQQLDAERLSVERRTAADEIAADVATVERLIGPWLASSREIADAFRKLDHVFEAGQLSGFISGCAGEAEVAAAVVLRELRDLPKLVVSGDRPIPHRPEPVAVVAAIPPAPTIQLFCMRPIRFRNANGELIVVQKFHDAELPLQTAKRALELRACVQLSDPLRRQHHNTTGGAADPALALDLDAPEPTHTSVAPELHSAFVPVDRGPGFTLRVAK